MNTRLRRVMPAVLLVISLAVFAPVASAQSRNSNAFAGVVGWITGTAVKAYYVNRGAFCPARPSFLPSVFNAACQGGTCAYPAR
jgi:hypothetical protein